MTRVLSNIERERITVRLRSQDLEMRLRLRPTASFVEKIVRRLVRDAKTRNAPGYLLIPNAREVLREPEAVLRFQLALMCAVHQHLREHNPAALTTRGLQALERKEKRGKKVPLRKSLPKVVTNDNVVINGLDSYRTLHTDEDSQLYVALCYYDVRGIRGGDPRILELRRLQKPGKDFDARSVLRAVPSGQFFDGESPFGDGHFVGKLRPGHMERGSRTARAITGLDYRQMPILLFSNRVEEALMHGATEVIRTGPRPSRRLRYVSIGSPGV